MTHPDTAPTTDQTSPTVDEVLALAAGVVRRAQRLADALARLTAHRATDTDSCALSEDHEGEDG